MNLPTKEQVDSVTKIYGFPTQEPSEKVLAETMRHTIRYLVAIMLMPNRGIVAEGCRIAIGNVLVAIGDVLKILQ